MRVLLVEPYYGGSHRAWADGFQAHSRHEVRLVTHEDRYWRWRLRGGSLTLADEVRREIDEHGPPDVLLVSGMVELAALLGLARRSLPAATPVALYLHESQLVHPIGPRQRVDDDNPAYANWLSMAAADHVFCNSEFHRDSLFDALPELLDRAPDHSHKVHLDAVRERTSVLPVGVDLTGIVDGRRSEDDGPPLVLWNQRWDHDKDPGRLLRGLVKLADQGVAFRLALAGENGRSDPREFDDAIAALGDRVVHVGFLDRADYVDLLLRSDVVVSTARHEFFGIAVVEAMAAGCVPLLPARLSYPELVPDPWHASCLYTSRPFERLRHVLDDIDRARHDVVGLRVATRAFAWDAIAPRYDEALDDVARQ